MIQKAALHGIGEDPTQTRVDSLNGALRERLSCFLILHLPQIGIELPEVLGAKLHQFEITQDRQEAVDVLPLPGLGGLGQLAGGNGLQP